MSARRIQDGFGSHSLINGSTHRARRTYVGNKALGVVSSTAGRYMAAGRGSDAPAPEVAMVLVGVSGDGKSTLGNMMCGWCAESEKTQPFVNSNGANSETRET